ncbi:hypothetical protein E4L95_05355 [Paracoccus liaowanqingii]|uniref:Uncharacterized protein n=1 Tax=Paracoccus liaowanqingii TaxID=2560053 RepID=A0A4Z1CQK0_9RHOB|nr:hypothetical protein [Paracoccus liaowanqingii]TGN67332.1 hypothetical protein E4L95_05355 [Paracoccus liaowanqingii]
MALHDLTKKTDAELMQFCTVIARTVTTLSNRIAAAAVPNPKDEAAVIGLTKRVEAALAELEKRHSGPHPGQTKGTLE